MSRVPPKLEFLVIYNKTIQAAPNVSKDNDDAQEEAHILFYTCRPGGVKRDRMLRQVGLAKALISFSESFTNGDAEACEMVHSARTKLVMVSPEKDYWIHACINVAYTETKNKDGTVKKEYHEASVHDTVLKTAVLRSYQEFRLLYGPFSNLLPKGREILERRLEKFFSVWAWKWELEQPVDFVSHLGTPVSPYSKYLTPMLDEVRTMLPEGTPVLLLSSRDLLASHPPAFSSLWSLLPLHLMRLIPPHEPTTSGSTPLSDPTKSLVKSAKGDGTLANQANVDALIRTHEASNANTTANFLTAMNPKKWADLLTFGGKGRSKVPTAQEAFARQPEPASDSAFVKHESLDPQVSSLPAPSRPNVDQKSLEATSSSVPVECTIGKASILDPRHTASASTTPPVPLFAPTLEYLSNAAGGLLGAMSLSGPPSNGNSESGDKIHGDVDTPAQEPRKEDSASELQVVVPGVDKKHAEEQELDQHDGPLQESQEETPAQQSLRSALLNGSAKHSQENLEGVHDQPSEQAIPSNAELPQIGSPSSQSSRRLSDASVKSAAPMPPPEAFFLPLSIYLEDRETKQLALGRVYHMTFGSLMLALIIQSSETLQSPTDTSTLSSRRFASFGGLEVLEGLGYPAYVDIPRGLEYKAVEILKRTRQSLEKLQADKGEGKGTSQVGKRASQNSTQASKSATGQGTRNFAVASLSDEADSVLASLGFSSTAGWLFEGQSALRRDNGILEQFSRTTTSQSWYISKRIPSAGALGNDREVHMEVSRKESNLVDVDNDLATIVRRLDATSS